MKLSTTILRRILAPATLLVATWTILFYFAILGEVNDEVDDALEEYAEEISQRYLAGEDLPVDGNGTNNSFHFAPLGRGPIAHTLSFSDEDVWIESKNEWEPARVLRTTFVDAQGDNYLLTVMTPTIEKKDLKEALFFWTSLLCLSLIGVVALISIAALRRSLKPLYRLLGWLDGNRLDSTHTPLNNPTNIIEFERLNRAAADYDNHNRALYEQQKEFVGNASHEMQTPLAICSNRLDLLAETPLTEEQLGEVLRVQSTLSQLSRLNHSLLLLTKIESNQFHEREWVDIGELVRQRLEDIADIYAHKSIGVEVEEEAPLVINMNRTLAEIATTNLLKNAFIHNTEGGSIVVRIGRNYWSVTNSGAPTPLDPERVFTRFYQPHKREGSTGLGLAITASVAHLYGFTPSYSYAPDSTSSRGLHTFSIRKEE